MRKIKFTKSYTYDKITIEIIYEEQNMQRKEYKNDLLRESKDWLLLLCSLLNKNTENAGFTVSLDNNQEAVITTQNQALVTQLNKVLRSPESVRANINYTVELKGSSRSSVVPVEPNYADLKLPELKHGIGKNVFEKLFGQSNLQRIGCPAWNQELENNLFIITALCEDELEELAIEQIQKYLKMLTSASFNQLREALALDKPLKLGQVQSGALSQNADKILYMTKGDGGKAIACFDFGLLLRCLSVPQFITTQQNDNTDHIKFKINDFMSYLSTILNEGFLLHIPESKDGKAEARPICFNAARAVPLEIVISLVLDCSGSMSNVFDEYLDQVMLFIKELAKKEEYQHAKIRIQPFATELFPPIERILAEKESLIDYLKRLSSNDDTLLNHAVLTELQTLQARSQTITGSVAVFTDGQDNKSTPETNQALAKLTSELKNDGNPPRVFAFSLGEQYDKLKCSELARLTGGSHHHLKDINEFTHYLSAHLDEYCRARRLVRFIEEESKRIVTVAVREGEIAVSENTIAIPNSFSINGGPAYSVKLGGRPLEAKLTAPNARLFTSQPTLTNNTLIEAVANNCVIS